MGYLISDMKSNRIGDYKYVSNLNKVNDLEFTDFVEVHMKVKVDNLTQEDIERLDDDISSLYTGHFIPGYDRVDDETLDITCVGYYCIELSEDDSYIDDTPKMIGNIDYKGTYLYSDELCDELKKVLNKIFKDGEVVSVTPLIIDKNN